nr:LacI family DNA-binding transcriptional regulator [uncultured Blautia sp.]
MASIRDVAQKAGVGVGTVSRVINGSGYVAEDTRKKSSQRSVNWNIPQMSWQEIFLKTGQAL